MQAAPLAREPTAKKTDDSDLSAVKTLRKALAILDAFATAEKPLSVAEVAVQTGVTRPTAHRLIQTLIAEGYLAQGPNGIRPGYSVLQLASSLLDTSHLRLEALPHLESLARGAGERVGMGILHRGQVLYLAGVEKPSLPTIYSRFGETVPAYCSAVGKAMLAHLAEADLQSFFAGLRLQRYTETTITDQGMLMSELADIRRDGFAVDRGEHSPATFCVGSAIMVRDQPVAGIAVIGRTLDSVSPHRDLVQHTAEVISHVLSRGA